jgi:hypothetical protein
MVKPVSYYMPVRGSINKGDYHLIELPFENIDEAKAYALQRMKDYPIGKQKIVKSTKTPFYYGVYELIDHKKVYELEKRIRDAKKREKK